MAVFDNGIKAAELGHSGTVETEGLLVGSRPAGASTPLALYASGIRNVNIAKYRWVADTLGVHSTEKRAVRFFRDVRVIADVEQLATPHSLKSPRSGAIND